MVRLHEWELLANNTWHHNNTWIYKLTSKPLWCKILKPHFPHMWLKHRTQTDLHTLTTQRNSYLSKKSFQYYFTSKIVFVCVRNNWNPPDYNDWITTLFPIHREGRGVAFSLNTVWIIKDKIFTLQCVHWILVQVFTAIYKVLHINYTHNLETIACSSTTETAAVCLRGLHIVRIQQPMFTCWLTSIH